MNVKPSVAPAVDCVSPVAVDPVPELAPVDQVPDVVPGTPPVDEPGAGPVPAEPSPPPGTGPSQPTARMAPN